MYSVDSGKGCIWSKQTKWVYKVAGACWVLFSCLRSNPHLSPTLCEFGEYPLPHIFAMNNHSWSFSEKFGIKIQAKHFCYIPSDVLLTISNQTFLQRVTKSLKSFNSLASKPFCFRTPTPGPKFRLPCLNPCSKNLAFSSLYGAFCELNSAKLVMKLNHGCVVSTDFYS